jgi:formylglycine-generating enzyme
MPWLESNRWCSGIASIALGLSLCGQGCDGLRPSMFTSGWQDPSSADGALPNQNAETTGSRALDEEDSDGQDSELPLKVFDDWRNHHDESMPCPLDMVLVQGSFCIDRWEGSLVEITPSGTRPLAHNARVEQRPVRAVSRPDVFPQAYISGAEAQRACQMAGKRLCSDQEWFDACEGPKRTIYPYGTVHRKGACNEDRSLHPIQQLYGPGAGPEIWMVEPMNDPAINQQPDTLSPTGSLARCSGPLQIFDMIGNVQEWTNDPSGNFRGGAYSTNNRIGCQYVTTVHGFGYHDYSTGFRCCSDPYPS